MFQIVFCRGVEVVGSDLVLGSRLRKPHMPAYFSFYLQKLTCKLRRGLCVVLALAFPSFVAGGICRQIAENPLREASWRNAHGFSNWPRLGECADADGEGSLGREF